MFQRHPLVFSALLRRTLRQPAVHPYSDGFIESNPLPPSSRSPVRQRDRSPAKRERSPPKRERSPPKRERSPPKRERSPPKRERSPPRRGSRSPRNQRGGSPHRGADARIKRVLMMALMMENQWKCFSNRPEYSKITLAVAVQK